MNERDLLEQFHSIDNKLRNLGIEIQEYVKAEILTYNLHNPDTSLSFCIDPEPRMKEDKSFITKALYRNKGYTDPIVQITDKVGIRFVVLTTADIDVIKEIIVGNKHWISSCDKDFQNELLVHPSVFDYQSVHYVIKRTNQDDFNDNNNPISCEVQIRTILQHSFAEISHLCAYKSPFKVESKTKRELARTMAFIDTSDMIFSQTRAQIEAALTEYRQWNKDCKKLLQTYEIKFEEYDVLNAEIFLYVFPKLPQNQRNQILQDITNLCETIREVVDDGGTIYFRQPMIALVVYYVNRSPRSAFSDWNIEPEKRQFLFTKLGFSIDSFN